jgi:putative endonuclease
MDCFAYIMAGSYRGTLYVGVTSNIIQRVHQHKQHVFDGFTARHAIDRLVWFEGTPSIEAAIEREKQIKNWKRAWKIELVEAVNPRWRDLYSDLLGADANDPGSRPG